MGLELCDNTLFNYVMQHVDEKNITPTPTDMKFITEIMEGKH